MALPAWLVPAPASVADKQQQVQSTLRQLLLQQSTLAICRFDTAEMRRKKNRGSGAGISSSSSSSRPRTYFPEVQKLQEDLAQLMSDWSHGERWPGTPFWWALESEDRQLQVHLL